jgi:diguanylate cyclase (GGDEF)-like protein/PAS domain S-box-containing protein
MQRRMLLASLSLTLLAGLLTWWMLKRQLEPLKATADAMVALSSRKQIPQALPVCGKDEIGQLTGGFNRLVETWIEREEALLKSEERWKFAIDGAGDGLWDWNTQTGEAFFSPRYKQMFGYADADFGATSDEWSKRIHPDDAPGVFAAIQPYMEGKPGAASVEFRMLCKDGSWKWVLGRGMVVSRDADGKPLRMIGTNSDITERKAHQSQLEHVAHFDALTHLPNRVLLADRLQQAMAQALRRAQHLAVAYLDLDGFKTINDQHGHDVGDQVLIALAQRMRQVLREGDSLARIGGDEFVIALLDVDDRVASLPMLNRLKAACAQNVQVGALSLEVSASVGITFYPQAQDIDADQLLRQADQAMYQAKLAGKNRLHFFDTTQDSSIRGRHESVERIRLALELHEFVLHYQPKVNMRSGQIVGAEALIRWQHPEKGLLSPAMFLPLIEDHPLAVDIGEWVLDTSLTQIERWHTAGLDMRVSVNVGSRQLQQSDFVDRLKFILAKHPQVKPSSLELEVLETSALEDIAQVSDVIEACERIGVKFALDDFGTGYSSLSYLKLLRVAMLKIDQSFVRDMLEDPDDLAILQGVIGLAAAFKRQVIAEGVETVAHGTLLLQLGCELAQGYGIAQPMSAQQMPAWSTAWRPDAAWRDFCRRPTRNRAARRTA